MLSGGLKHEYTVTSGDNITGVLELRNTSPTSAEIKIYQEDIVVNGAGRTEYAQTINRGTHNRSNASWINLGFDRIILEPNEKRTVTYSIRVPNDRTISGSYWSTLMLEPVSKKSPESQLTQQIPKDQPTLTLNQKMRYSVQILTHVRGNGQSKPVLKFLSPKIEKNTQNKRSLYFHIQNTGNRYSRPDVWLDVFSLQGNKLHRLKAETHGLYINEKEAFHIDLSPLKTGKYKALLAAEDNGTGQIFGSDINLTIEP